MTLTETVIVVAYILILGIGPGIFAYLKYRDKS